MGLFLVKFFLTNIVFSVILCSLFARFNESGRYSNSELLLYSLGLGPAFTTLLLYYLFLLLPHRSNTFYLTAIVFSYFVIAVMGRLSFQPLFRELKNNIKKIFIIDQCASLRHRIEHGALLALIIMPLAAFLYAYLTKILPQPLIGGDALTYGMKGRILFDEKSLAPIWVLQHASSGFASYTNNPPSFPLLLTWEELVNFLFQAKSDLYYKSINTYYGLLILSILSYWMAKQNRGAAVLSVFALLSGMSFFILLLQPHLDLYRIFFFSISFIWLAYAVKEKDYLSVFMLGIFSGFTAFAHRIGAVMAVINCFVFFITSESRFTTRISKTVILVLLILIFGGAHYIFDLFWGLGFWIQPLKYR